MGGGLLLGGVVSLWGVRFIEAFLFQTSPSDPLVVLLAAGLVAASSLAAGD